MSDVSTDLISALDDFVPADDNWLPLDLLLQQLFEHPVSSAGIAAMLRVFERFPTEDGAGVFWTIIHGLESVPDYESLLVESVQRVPSEMGVIMLGRILNSGQGEISGVSISSLLSAVQIDPRASPEAQSSALSFQTRNA